MVQADKLMNHLLDSTYITSFFLTHLISFQDLNVFLGRS